MRGFWVELASYRKFKSNRVSGKCAKCTVIFRMPFLWIRVDISDQTGVLLLSTVSPFEWVPEQLSRFLTDPTIATLLEHPGQ